MNGMGGAGGGKGKWLTSSPAVPEAIAYASAESIMFSCVLVGIYMCVSNDAILLCSQC